MKGRKAAGEDVHGYIAEHPEAALIQAARASERRVSAMRRHRRELAAADGDREEIKSIEERMQEEMRRFNDVIREARR